MSCWLKRLALAISIIPVLILCWSVADAFLFRYRVQQMFREVQGVPLGTPVENVRWLERKYPEWGKDVVEEDVRLQAGLTPLEFADRRGGIRILPKDLLMRPAGADAALIISYGKVDGRYVRLSAFNDRVRFLGPSAEVEELDTRNENKSGDGIVIHKAGFDILETKGNQNATIVIHFDANASQRQAAYAFDFHCLWRWNRCDSATDLLTAGKQ